MHDSKCVIHDVDTRHRSTTSPASFRSGSSRRRLPPGTPQVEGGDRTADWFISVLWPWGAGTLGQPATISHR